MRAKRLQSGYMMEIPLLMMAAAVALAILLPKLPIIVGKVLVVIAALVWIGGLYYMIVIPGWMPGNRAQSRLRLVGRWILFLALALLLSFVAGAYILGAGPA